VVLVFGYWDRNRVAVGANLVLLTKDDNAYQQHG